MTQNFNPAQSASTIVLSNAYLTATQVTSANDCIAYGGESVSSGRYYWEVKVNASAMANAGAGIGNTSSTFAIGNFLGQGTDSVGWFGNGSVFSNNASAATWASYTSGQTLCFALDLTSHKLWGRVGAAGNWNNDVIGNQNPAVGSQVGGLTLNAAVYAHPVVPGVNLHNNTLPDSAVGAFLPASLVGTPPAGFSTFIGPSIPIPLGSNIQTIVSANAAGSIYQFAAGTYRGQSFTPQIGDTYLGDTTAVGTVLSGAWNVTSWTNVSANWYRATQGLSDANGVTQTNFPQPLTLARITGFIAGTTLTVSTVTNGTFALPGGGTSQGASIYGNGITSGMTLVANLSGSGVGSTWTVSVSQTIGSGGSPISMVLCDQKFENATQGGAPNDPLCYSSEELFVDGVRYTRIQAAATPVAPGANQWFYDYSNNSVNINLASPASHLVEYSCTQALCNTGSGAAYTFYNTTWEKYAWFQQGALTSFPDGSITLNNCQGRFNKGCGVNLSGNTGFLGIYGGKYNDNGENGIIGSPDKGYIVGAEIARNNQSLAFSGFYQASGIKYTGATDSIVVGCLVHDNGGPGIWNDIFSIRNVIEDNTCTNNFGPGIMDEISTGAKIISNTVSGSGQNAGSSVCAGIYISNSSNVEAYGNKITVGIGNSAAGRVGGGIDSYNGVRGSFTTNASCSFTGTVTGGGTTLTVASLTGTVVLGMFIYGTGVINGSYLVKQLTGTTGSTGTYQLSYPQPALTGRAMLGVYLGSGMLCECRNNSIHHNTITFLDNVGSYDSIAVDQAIVGGSNNYRDYNTYYTPNGTGQFWYRGTDAGVNKAYVWADYQAAGFEPNSINIVGLPPAVSPLVASGLPITP